MENSFYVSHHTQHVTKYKCIDLTCRFTVSRTGKVCAVIKYKFVLFLYQNIFDDFLKASNFKEFSNYVYSEVSVTPSFL